MTGSSVSYLYRMSYLVSMAEAQSSIRRRRRSKITARICCVCRVAHRMSERRFDHFAGCVRPLRRPIPKARPEPMRHGGDAEFFDQFRQRHGGEWLPAPTAEHEAGAIAQSRCVVQDRERAPRCAGTHRRADCAASPARTWHSASRGAAAQAPRRRLLRPWVRAEHGAARSADLRLPAPAYGGRTPRRAPRPATPAGSRRARASGVGLE